METLLYAEEIAAGWVDGFVLQYNFLGEQCEQATASEVPIKVCDPEQKSPGDTVMLSSELHQRMVMYSEGQISLSELEAWITPRLRFFFKEVNSVEGDIVATVESLIVEHRDGLLTEDELCPKILELLE